MDFKSFCKSGLTILFYPIGMAMMLWFLPDIIRELQHDETYRDRWYR